MDPLTLIPWAMGGFAWHALVWLGLRWRRRLQGGINFTGEW